MKSRILTALLVFGIAASAAFGQAKFEIEGGETFNWGKSKPPADGQLSASVKMYNKGDRELKITQIKPGCGCTKTDPDKYDVVPGDMSTMDVKLNISPSQSGPITKSITIRWGDKEGLAAAEAARANGTEVPAGLDTTEHVTFLFLKADIQRAIMIEPSIYFSFQGLSVGEESQSKLTLTNNTEEEIVFSDWDADGGLVLNQTGKVKVAPGQTLDLVATLVPALKGQYSGKASFKTSHEDHPTFDVRAYGFVKDNASPVYQKPAE